jgi:hypothetical protein
VKKEVKVLNSVLFFVPVLLLTSLCVSMPVKG